jgi:hypothetical protein
MLLLPSLVTPSSSLAPPLPLLLPVCSFCKELLEMDINVEMKWEKNSGLIS